MYKILKTPLPMVHLRMSKYLFIHFISNIAATNIIAKMLQVKKSTIVHLIDCDDDADKAESSK
jgi:hypothetical protein